MNPIARASGRGLVDLTSLLSDTVDFAEAGFVTCKGAAGNIVVTDYKGNTSTYPIALGEVLPVLVTRVNSTLTTATGLWLYVR